MKAGDKYLITTNEWFTGENGDTYKAVWGQVKVMSDEFLGIQTNRNSSNWFLMVGSEDKHIIIAGCQIHYAIKCKDKPNTEMAQDWNANHERINIFQRPGLIYITE